MSLEKFERSSKELKLAKHGSSILDLAIVMDCTGSMGSYIQSATERIREIVEEIVEFEEAEIKLALVEYRDHPPEETTFVTRTHDFTESVDEMKKWLENCTALGGGDTPEALADGLEEAFNLNWRSDAIKICFIITDAPPHGLGNIGDKFRHGCPLGIDPMKVVHQMAEKGITLYSVGCEPAITPYKEFFSAIAFTTGGQYVPLRNAKLLAKVIVGGAVEEISLEKLMEEVQEEVRLQQECGVLDEKELASAVESKLHSKEVKTKQILLNNLSLEKPTQKVVKYSTFTKLTDVKNEHTKREESFSYSIQMRKMKDNFGKPGSTWSLYNEVESGPAYSFANASPFVDDTYTISNDLISAEQSLRLVQKVIKRKDYKRIKNKAQNENFVQKRKTVHFVKNNDEFENFYQEIKTPTSTTTIIEKINNNNNSTNTIYKSAIFFLLILLVLNIFFIRAISYN